MHGYPPRPTPPVAMEETTSPSILAAGFVWMAAAAVVNARPVLTIFAYDSIAYDLGPAVPEVDEPRCGCALNFVPLGGRAALVPRLVREAALHRPDLVLGIEPNNLARARATGLFAPHGISASQPDLPVVFTDPLFLPYAWSRLACIDDANRLEDEPPQNFRELIDSERSLVLQNRHTLTTGLGLVMRIEAAYGAEAEDIWRGLAARISRVVPSWANAYHPIFRQGQADMVLSYETSPGWHLSEENDDGPRAALFEAGHSVRIEVAATFADAAKPERLRDFLSFTQEPAFQALIPKIRVMYPVATPPEGLPPALRKTAAPEPHDLC